MSLRILLLTAFLTASASADEASDLAGKLSAIRQDGTSFVRLRMEIPGAGSLQIQTKERRTQGRVDVIYQILFPKERKGESVLLRKSSGGAPSGSVFIPPDTVKPLTSGQMSQGLFGSDLAYEDITDNFFAWPNQTLVGTEDIGRATCQILESKPGKGDRTSYASVRSWIDSKRLVPMRVEKYSAPGRLARRIDTTNVEKDDLGRSLPATLTVRRAEGSQATTIEGSRIRHNVTLTDSDFTPEGLKVLTAPKSAD